ncbi:MAG: hypothetical protein EKK62_04080 [Acidimicrobiia bacterium]|nr:MAG: hypothetical protein EKK62_04080 [Acidimicrobiia bacterium]
MIRAALTSLATRLLGVDTLDALELARRYHALDHLAREAEDRAEVAETAAEEYRALYLEAEVTIRGLERDLAVEQRRNMNLKGYARDVAKNGVAEVSAALHDLRIYQHNARVRSTRKGLLARRLEEALRALDIARGEAERHKWAAIGENRKKREAERERDDARAELERARAETDITPSLSTAKIKERIYREWEAVNAHGGMPVEAAE